jgi:hypothetical protein
MEFDDFVSQVMEVGQSVLDPWWTCFPLISLGVY